MHRILLLLFLSLVFSTKSTIKAQDTLRVISYNIWNGFDWGKDTVRKEGLMNWLKSQKADVIGWQELCNYDSSKLKEDAQKLGHNYSILLKSTGYSVGISSKFPIQLKGKITEGMWHGLLHCEIEGIDFFVTHLSPSDFKTRQKETRKIVKLVQNSENKETIILGDFNAHSPFDGDYLKANRNLRSKYLKGDLREDNPYKNLDQGEFDFSSISNILSLGVVDLCQLYREPSERYSFPTPALTGSYLTQPEIESNKERIDYIFASRSLALRCMNAQIYNGPDVHYLSDHFPVIAEFIR